MNLIIAVGFVLIYYSWTIYLLRGIKFTAYQICLCGIVAAMTLVLESIYIPLPTGTTISLCSPVPLMLLAILTDYRLSIVTGWVCAVLAMLLIPSWQVIHWGQFFLEHMVCFSCLGYAGIFGTDKKYQLVGGVTWAFCLKTMGHLISGVVFFSQNTWSGWGTWGYSIVYNLSQNIPLCILSGILILMMPLKTMKLAANLR